ncbi:hypothetical protein [Leuconostoc mesenteroides]|uniref:hypothetical protein n=1 Tax=Leuconostoc mesenteroides TaxID=1245 RepID=UPI0021C1F992|nr:hypothetical protein [Leuconostoc mesenteroides]MCT8386064.1 hypothetical protein [Leuconostoc mesenteroides]
MVKLTSENHGAFSNPHPQYENVTVYQSQTDNSANGDPWIKFLDINLAQPDLHLYGTIQRIFFGFTLIDNASDNEFSTFDFSGQVAIDYNGNIQMSGTKDYRNKKFASTNFSKISCRLFYLKKSDNSYNLKGYLYAPWKYKRLAIINPWINIPQDRLSSSRTNILTAKVAQFMKTKAIFSTIKTEKYISDDDLNTLVTGYSSYSFPLKREVSYTKIVNFDSGIQVILGRQGLEVTINVRGGSANIGSDNVLGTLPAGYRPVSGAGIATFRYDGDGTISPITITPNGVMTLVSAIPKDKIIFGTGSYVTNDSFPEEDA